MIDALRTPDERFDGLAGWDYPPFYVGGRARRRAGTHAAVR